MDKHLKKHLLFIVFFSFAFFTSLIAEAQDIIIKNDKTEIKAKVIEITNTELKYKKFEFQDGPTYNIDKADVFMVLYSNGQRETFTTPGSTSKSPQENKPANPRTESKSNQTNPNNKNTGQENTANKPTPVQSPNQENTDKTISTGGNNSWSINKKQSRYIGGFSLTTYTPVSGSSEPDLGYGFKLAFEKLGAFKSDMPNIGLGFCYNSYLDMGGYSYQGMHPYVYKHFLSAYLLGEIDLKNIITIGGSAGPSFVTNTFNTGDGGVDEVIFGGGLHFSQYIQKYLISNKDGKKVFFVRWGFDQYFSINSGTVKGGCFAIGF